MNGKHATSPRKYKLVYSYLVVHLAVAILMLAAGTIIMCRCTSWDLLEIVSDKNEVESLRRIHCSSSCMIRKLSMHYLTAMVCMMTLQSTC